MQKNKLVSKKKRTNSKRKVVSKKKTNSKRKTNSKKRTNSKRKVVSKKRTNSKKKTLSKRKIKRGGEGELTIEEIDDVLKKDGVKCYINPKKCDIPGPKGDTYCSPKNTKCSVFEIKKLHLWDTIELIEKYKRVNNIIVGPYLDLSNKNLSGADLTGANLTGADLTGANLTGADLTKAKLTLVKSRDIKGEPKSLPEGCKVEKGYLVGPNVNLTGADLTGANLYDTDLTEANLTGADLSNANLSNAKLKKTDLTDADLTGVKFENATLDEQNLTYINIKNADFTKARSLYNVDFIGSDLTGAKFEGARLTKIDFRRTKGVNLTGADLNSKIDLREAKDYKLGNNKRFKKNQNEDYYILTLKNTCHDYDDDANFCANYEAKGHECIYDIYIGKCRMKQKKDKKNNKTKLPIPIYNRPISVQNVGKTIGKEVSGVAAVVL